LLGYFGDQLDEPCGNCDRCSAGLPEDAASATVDGPGEFGVHTEVEHRSWGRGTVMSTEDDRITVFFRSQGYKVLALEAVREGDLLVPVGPE
jgi:ATP-dependent DNA helicase RecQ